MHKFQHYSSYIDKTKQHVSKEEIAHIGDEFKQYYGQSKWIKQKKLSVK